MVSNLERRMKGWGMTSTTKLFLSADFKTVFEKIPDPDGGVMPLVIVLTKVLNSINEYNPKMKVTEIRFVPQDESFGLMKECDSKFFGIFAETLEDGATSVDAKDGDVWIENASFGIKIHRAVAYAIMAIDTGSRNAVVSQQAFPSLFTLIRRNLTSPGLTLTDRPIYLIDLLSAGHEEGTQASSIRRSFIAMCASGSAVVCPFHKGFSIEDLPSLPEYVVNSAKKGESCLSLDEETKTLCILGKYTGLFDDTKVVNTKNKKVGVYGSNDKFYATIILGGFCLARRFGYKVDLSPIHDAFAELDRKQKTGWTISGKYENLKSVLDYMEKVMRR